ncbi:hypothetical protein ECC02_003374 [Trypanosoma cruzi]|uniref:Uncharacterized protein n=1 Tax=Trypanosoma cruzi TaxID=5693 RepID=A0A7J6YAN9_TRYCR|nr:hypothetical protein ECC02_003374 [Trypanosoma cruzi]
MFGVTVLAVTKVVVAVCIGAFASQRIPNASVTVRDFTFVIANILLPCLTFYNVASSINAELLIRCSVLFFFSLFVIGSGLLCGTAASKLMFRVSCSGIPHGLRDSLRYTLIYQDAEGRHVKRAARGQRHLPSLKPVVCVLVSGALETQEVEPEEVLPLLEPPGVEYEEQPFYQYASLIACSLQNTVTLPLSLLQALAESLAWIDLAAGTSFIFIYSLSTTASLWSFGPALVGRAQKETNKRRKIRELLELHKKLQGCCDVATQTEVNEEFSLIASPIGLNAPPFLSGKQPNAKFLSTIREAASKKIVHEKEGEENASKMMAAATAHSTGEQTDIPPGAWRWCLAAAPATVETFHYNWKERGLISVMYTRDFEDEAETERQNRNTLFSFLRALKNIGVRLFKTVAFTSLIAGLVVGLTPPLRWLLFEGPLSMLTDSIALVAQGSIPSSLLLLGANLMGSTSLTAPAPEVRLREAEQNTEFPLDDTSADPKDTEDYNERHEVIEFDEHASFTLMSLQQQLQQAPVVVSTATSCENSTTDSPDTFFSGSGWMSAVRRVFTLHGVWKSFVFGIIFIRLLVIPAAGFLLVLLLRRTAPSLFGEKREQNVLILVLLGELAAPTAINGTILFNSRQYMPGVWSRMLFFQYLICTLTIVLWCSLSLWIVT